MSDPENVPECDSCHARGVDLQAYDDHRNRKAPKKRILCWLCASTPAGIAQEYPEQFPEQIALLRTVCFVGNEILKALKKPHGWHCGCGWPNGIELATCAQCGRTPLDGLGVPF